MLGLAFQNPDMMFFTSFQEGECCLCSKRTRSFFLASLNSALCLDCFDIFFAKRNVLTISHKTDGGLNSVAEEYELHGGQQDEHL
ncbi:MAG TPA: hypothetical protein VHT73_01755 [Thermodesulfobacteriota bacterium]|nr:hypothetical protein [Thermodesulfobacteriota bacterium]